MPINLLHRIADRELPIAITDGADIDALRVLILAGHVKSEIPRPVRTLNGVHQPAAMVTGITPMGHVMLKRFPRR